MDADVYADAARVLYYSKNGDWDSLKRIMAENSMERLNLIGKAGLELGQLAYVPALAAVG